MSDETRNKRNDADGEPDLADAGKTAGAERVTAPGGTGDRVRRDSTVNGDGEEKPGANLPDVPRIRLRAPSGVVIDHTLPLHEAIDGQWRRGELQRVGDEDEPWEGNEYDLSDAYGQPSDGDREDADGEREDESEDDGNHALAGGAGQFERADGINGHHGPVTENVATSGVQQPERPADNAPKKVWQDYAVAIGAVDADEAAGMTRAQLAEKSTPPELRPDVPEV